MEDPTGSREARLAQFKILEAQRAMEEPVGFLRRLKEEAVDVDDLSDFIMAFWPTSTEKRTILQMLGELGENERLSEKVLAEIDYFSRLLIPQKFEALDNLTTLASTRIVREGGDQESWFLYSRDILIANFGQGEERAFGYCVGRPGSGKTNVAVLAIQAALGKGWDAVTNIHPQGAVPQGFHYTNRLSGLLREGAQLRLEEVPFLAVLDEGGLWWAKAQAMRRESQGLDKVARVIGKLGASTLFIEQREASVPSTVSSFARSAFYCGPPGRVRIEHRGPLHFYRKLSDVPRAEIRYDSRDISYLAYDLEVDALFAQVGEVGAGGEAQARAILAYLDGEREVDVEAKRYAARLMADTGKLSQREIAAQLGVNQSTVSKWLRASREPEMAS